LALKPLLEHHLGCIFGACGKNHPKMAFGNLCFGSFVARIVRVDD
jgi:hypothetical protein